MLALGRTHGRNKRCVRDHCGIYFLRRPRTTSTAPEINASAVAAESGLISGTGEGGPNAKPAIPINSNMLPNSFTMDLLLSDGQETTDAASAASAIVLDATSDAARA